MIKILIVEDQELIRQSLEIILSSQPGLSVIGLAGNGNEAVEMAGALSPDVILLDIRMPGMDGVSACRIIKEKYPGIKIIVLTTFDDDEYVFDAIKYGANGDVYKRQEQYMHLARPHPEINSAQHRDSIEALDDVFHFQDIFCHHNPPLLKWLPHTGYGNHFLTDRIFYFALSMIVCQSIASSFGSG